MKVTSTPRNLGRVANYRRCLYELTSGDWAVNLDGDDYYDDTTFFSAAMEALADHPQAVLYAAGAKCMDEARGTISPAPLRVSAELTLMDGADYVLGWPALGASQHFAAVYDRRMALDTNFYVLDSLGADTIRFAGWRSRGRFWSPTGTSASGPNMAPMHPIRLNRPIIARKWRCCVTSRRLCAIRSGLAPPTRGSGTGSP